MPGPSMLVSFRQDVTVSRKRAAAIGKNLIVIIYFCLAKPP